MAATKQRESRGVTKYCPDCKAVVVVYDEQTICPKCNSPEWPQSQLREL